MTMNLDTCSLLVNVNISGWSGRRLDKQATREIVASKNAASSDAARVTKSLFAGRTELKELESYAAMVRNFVASKTLPWDSCGTQLLPTIQFLEFDKQIKDFEQTFYTKVQEFLAIYPSLIAAQAFALGNMFKRDDYPTVEDIQHKFYFSVTYSPVPAAGDFRVDVGVQAQEELRQRLEEVTERRVSDMQTQLANQMGEQLKRMSYILGGVYKTRSNKGEEIEKSRNIYPSLLTDAWDLIRLAEGLRISSPAMLEAVTMLKDAISGKDVKELKAPEVKADVKKDIDAILNKFSWS